VALYKLLINALPLALPAMQHAPHPDVEAQSLPELPEKSHDQQTPVFEVALKRKRPRLTLTQQAQQKLIRKRTRRWHATLAGAVAGGLAIMFEIRSRRTVIGQQLFVRFVIYLSLPVKHVFIIFSEGCKDLGMRLLQNEVSGSLTEISSCSPLRMSISELSRYVPFQLTLNITGAVKSCTDSCYGPTPFHVPIILGNRRPPFPGSARLTFVGHNRISHASKVPPPAVKMNRDIVRDRTVHLSDLVSLFQYEASLVA
jgi:hypothetical protein